MHVVVLGAGQAGLQVATSLREEGFTGRITLIGDEPHIPYQRPPLSKAYLAGTTAEPALFMCAEEALAGDDIAFRRGTAAVAIHRESARVELASGETIQYDHLVLATGTRNRSLPCADARLSGVFSLRGLDDARGLAAALVPPARMVVIGAGFLGLEAASVAAAKGCAVRVVETASRPLARVASPVTSAAFLRGHGGHGIEFDFGDTVVALHGAHGAVTGVELRAGRLIPADLVLVSIGVVPNAELAAAAGLAVHDGIVVDAMLLTEDPAISAIGDCAAFPYAADGGRMVRLESVQNAVDQARLVARRLAGQPAAAYDQVPLFWSDQAGLRLQIAGLTTGEERHVVRGDPEAPAFSVFCYRGDRLVAVESVNRLPDHMQARRLLRAGVSPSPAQAADPGFDLKSALLAIAA